MTRQKAKTTYSSEVYCLWQHPHRLWEREAAFCRLLASSAEIKERVKRGDGVTRSGKCRPGVLDTCHNLIRVSPHPPRDCRDSRWYVEVQSGPLTASDRRNQRFFTRVLQLNRRANGRSPRDRRGIDQVLKDSLPRTSLHSNWISRFRKRLGAWSILILILHSLSSMYNKMRETSWKESKSRTEISALTHH